MTVAFIMLISPYSAWAKDCQPNRPLIQQSSFQERLKSLKKDMTILKSHSKQIQRLKTEVQFFNCELNKAAKIPQPPQIKQDLIQYLITLNTLISNDCSRMVSQLKLDDYDSESDENPELSPPAKYGIEIAQIICSIKN